MKIITSPAGIQKQNTATVIALGTFDGLHLGHQDVIAAARHYASQNACRLAVFTFSNHPLELINAKAVPARLITPAEKIALLEAWGVDILINVEFNEALAGLTPESFLDKLSILNYQCLVVGENYSYGHLGKGRTASLRQSGLDGHFAVIVRPMVELAGEVVSSSAIRAYIRAGEITKANAMLGRCYAIGGQVVAGASRGRKLGFPTANIELAGSQLAIPADGVYAVSCSVGGKLYQGMANIGNNPTFGDIESVRLEVHLFGVERDLYGKMLTVQFERYLRGQKRFATVEDLQKQLATDKINAEQYFNDKK